MSSKNSFPHILWSLLQEELDCIKWDDEGNKIIIKKEPFTNLLLNRKLFNCNEYSNFQRQMNTYGFRRLKAAPEIDVYLSVFFKRDNEFSANILTRNVNDKIVQTAKPLQEIKEDYKKMKRELLKKYVGSLFPESAATEIRENLNQEGASSSSTSVDEVDSGQDSKTQSYSSNPSTLSTNDTSCSTVSSSGHVASSSQGILGMSRISCNPFAIKSSTPTKSVADSTDNKDSKPIIAPPVLKLDNTASKIVLRPSALALQAEKFKPTNKHDSGSKQEGKENSSDESNIVKECFSVSESNGKISKSEIFTCSSISTSADKTVSSSSKTCATESSYFSSFTEKKPDDMPSNSGGFVFGQNLHERVLNYDSSNEHPASPPDSHNLTFEEAALKKEDLEKMEQQNQEEKMKKSLTESAKEYESRQVKRKFDEVAVVTGEEEESNVLQINCKLFAFDKTNMNWQERGRGTLRLNDREHNGTLHSRLVMRVQGSLRVVLNTKVWAGMSVEHPSEKSVRLTAFDPQGVKVFLVMAQPKDADQLYNALNCRVATLRSDNIKNDDDLPVVEEATSSSTLPDASDSSVKHIRLSDNCSADSSTEASFPPQDTSSESGTADSTDVQT